MALDLSVVMARQVMLERQLQQTTHNLANANTSGYQRVNVLTEPSKHKWGLYNQVTFPSNGGISRDTTPGEFTYTGNPFDVGIGEDGYLAVQGPEGTAYTRDGQMTQNGEGQLVNSSGHPILDDGDAPLTIPAGSTTVTILKDGTVVADKTTVGRLKIVQFKNADNLQAIGQNLYTSSEQPEPAKKIAITQFGLVGSNVNAVIETTHLMSILREYEKTQKYLQLADERLGQENDNLINVPQAI